MLLENFVRIFFCLSDIILKMILGKVCCLYSATMYVWWFEWDMRHRLRHLTFGFPLLKLLGEVYEVWLCFKKYITGGRLYVFLVSLYFLFTLSASQLWGSMCAFSFLPLPLLTVKDIYLYGNISQINSFFLLFAFSHDVLSQTQETK